MPVSSLAPGDSPAMFRATQEFVPTAQYFVAISGLLLLLLTIALAVSRGVQKDHAAFVRALGAIVLMIALAATMTSCGGTTKASIGTNTSTTGSTGSSGSSASSGGGTMGSGGGTGGSTSVTFPVTVQAQSGSAIVNLGTITVTVP